MNEMEWNEMRLMNEWINEWMNEMNESNELMNEWNDMNEMNACMNNKMKEWKNEWMNEWMKWNEMKWNEWNKWNEWMNERMNEMNDRGPMSPGQWIGGDVVENLLESDDSFWVVCKDLVDEHEGFDEHALSFFFYIPWSNIS